jgi:hypothetical protein
LRTRLLDLPLPWLVLTGLLLLLLTGCHGGRSEVRGKPPAGSAVAVASLARAPASGVVAVRGKMVEK